MNPAPIPPEATGSPGDARKPHRRRRALLLLLLLLFPVLGFGALGARELSDAGRDGAASSAPLTASGAPSERPAPSVPASQATASALSPTPTATPYTGESPGDASPPPASAPPDGGRDSPTPTDLAFEIRGDVGPLMPGRAATIRLVLRNPNSVPILVTGVTVHVAGDSVPPGCPSADNLRLVQPAITAADPLPLPAGGEVVLDDAPRAPQVELLDLRDVNQDACQGVRFRLTFTGTATW